MRIVLIFVVTLAVNFSITSAFSPYCKKKVLRQVERNINGVKTLQQVPHLVRICCEGYTKIGRKCVPVCDNMCLNSMCTAPNTCSCHRGYKKLNSYRCGPRCDNCKYGICVSPGVCSCYKGYTKNPITKKCEPSCSKPCVNAVCADHDFCKCNEGYRISPSDLFTCIKNETIKSTTTTEVFTTLEPHSSTGEGETTFKEDYKWYLSTSAEGIQELATHFDQEQSSTLLEQLLTTSTIRPVVIPIKKSRSYRMMKIIPLPIYTTSTTKWKDSELTTPYSEISQPSSPGSSVFFRSTIAPSERIESSSEAGIDRTTTNDSPTVKDENPSTEKRFVSTEVNTTSVEGNSTLAEVDSTYSEEVITSNQAVSTDFIEDSTDTRSEEDATPTDKNSSSIMRDPTSTKVDSISSEKDIISVVLPQISSAVQEEIKSFGHKDTTLFTPTETAADAYNTKEDNNEEESEESTVGNTEPPEFKHSPHLVKPSYKGKNITVAKGSVLNSNLGTSKCNLSLLYYVFAIAAFLSVVIFAFFMCFQGRKIEYNMARLEKKKGVAKYSVERNDLITAWK